MQRRNTSSKVAVLSLLQSAEGAMSHDMIERELTEEVNRSTIYRILNRFVDDGIVHRIVAEDGRQYFAPCAGCTEEEHRDDHPHFHCMACERIECLPQPVTIDLPRGYRSESLNVTVSGYCSDCTDVNLKIPTTTK